MRKVSHLLICGENTACSGQSVPQLCQNSNVPPQGKVAQGAPSCRDILPPSNSAMPSASGQQPAVNSLPLSQNSTCGASLSLAIRDDGRLARIGLGKRAVLQKARRSLGAGVATRLMKLHW